MRRPLAVVLSAAAALTLAGCTPGTAPPPTSTTTVVGTGPTPISSAGGSASATASPATSGAPSAAPSAAVQLCGNGTPAPAPCTAAELEAVESKANEYREAQEASLALGLELERVLRNGGVADERFWKLLAPELRPRYEKIFEGYRSGGVGIISGEASVKWYLPAPSQVRDGALLAVEGCIDNTGMISRRPDGSVGPGQFSHTLDLYEVREGKVLVTGQRTQVSGKPC